MLSPIISQSKLFGIIPMRVISTLEFKQTNWQTAILLILGFWLSAILLLDWVVMPSLYVSGMMTTDGFASAGYSVFWIFNRLELIAAALIVSGSFALAKQLQISGFKTAIAILLLAVSLLETYFLTPQMSAIAINLNPFGDVSCTPAGMNFWHGLYWGLEVTKLAVLGVLLKSFWPHQS